MAVAFTVRHAVGVRPVGSRFCKLSHRTVEPARIFSRGNLNIMGIIIILVDYLF